MSFPPTLIPPCDGGVLSEHITSAVGRTGSGKSTLTLALLRCIYTEGAVLYDGVATNQINLDALRSNITIIPQSVRRCLLTSLHRISDLCVLMITSRAHTYSRSY